MADPTLKLHETSDPDATTNAERAAWFAEIATTDHYMEHQFVDESGVAPEMLIDVLVDAMHWSDREGVDFSAALATAAAHYVREVEAKGNGAAGEGAFMLAAAPDMLEALRTLMEWAAHMGGWEAKAWQTGRAAINKATGERTTEASRRSSCHEEQFTVPEADGHLPS